MRKTFLLGGAAAALFAAGLAQAGDAYPWRGHAAPFPFLFGNDIDGHQQTRLRADGSLTGYLYVQQTGVVTKDGYPVASHANCATAPDSCIVGWTIDGKPTRAMVYQQPMHDHPLFTVSRADIPQPGSYSHFHWTGMAMPHYMADGYLLQLVAQNRFCFIHHDAGSATSGMSCQDNGGLKVERGVDLATHLNVVPVLSHGM